MGNCWRGEPEILERPEPLDAMVSDWPLLALLGEVINLGLADDADGSRWLVLTAGGPIVALDPDDERVSALATVELVDEPEQQPWMDRQLRRRLHVSGCGRFAASGGAAMPPEVLGLLVKQVTRLPQTVLAPQHRRERAPGPGERDPAAGGGRDGHPGGGDPVELLGADRQERAARHHQPAPAAQPHPRGSLRGP